MALGLSSATLPRLPASCRGPVSDLSFHQVLDVLTHVAARAVPGADFVSVTLLGDDDKPYTSHASDPAACDLDRIQYSEASGPCLEAIQTDAQVNAVMADSTNRWPRFAEATLQAGIGSVLSSPLHIASAPAGSLNIYASDLTPFPSTEQDIAHLLANQAATLVAGAGAYREMLTLNEQLHEALGTRDLIGQAKGILMEREGCDPDRAFDILRRASQRSNRKLRDVAAELIESALVRKGVR